MCVIELPKGIISELGKAQRLPGDEFSIQESLAMDFLKKSVTNDLLSNSGACNMRWSRERPSPMRFLASGDKYLSLMTSSLMITSDPSRTPKCELIVL